MGKVRRLFGRYDYPSPFLILSQSGQDYRKEFVNLGRIGTKFLCLMCLSRTLVSQ